MAWTVEQILALAPDPASAKSGKDQSAARKWQGLGTDGASAWGLIQGSGKDPYQASVDLGGPAFKCTCPSRKFPCKHGLGLLLLLAQQPAVFTASNPPAWTSEWLAKRREKEEKRAAPAEVADVPPDPEAAAKAAAAAEKRAQARENKVAAGLQELGVWLQDLVRTGFSSLPGKPSSFWETPAARLVDAQAPGLARRVRALDGVTASGETWPERLLREVALLHLAREGWTRLASLPPGTQADVRSVLGFTVAQEELLAQPGVADDWLVVGQRVEAEDRLRVQRTWLHGVRSRRWALCLSFSAGPQQGFDFNLPPGCLVPAELVFYPGNWPVRALVKSRREATSADHPALPHATIQAACTQAAEACRRNPWIERVPMVLAAVSPVRCADRWLVRDEAGHGLPLAVEEESAWRLLALSGGRSLGLSGEWDGERLAPLGVWAEGRFITL